LACADAQDIKAGMRASRQAGSKITRSVYFTWGGREREGVAPHQDILDPPLDRAENCLQRKVV